MSVGRSPIQTRLRRIQGTLEENSDNENSDNQLTENLTESQGTNRVDSTNMALPNGQVVTLRDAVEVVPYFSGRNIPITQFVDGCYEALSMLTPNAEGNLVKLIRTRLTGEAHRIIKGQSYDKISELITALKSVYAPIESVNQIRGELGRIYQRDTEDVITFVNRVRDIGDRILDAHRTVHDGQIDVTFRSATEEDVKEGILQGLKPEIEQRLGDVETLSEVCEKAIRIERLLSGQAERRRFDRFQESRSETRGNSRENPRWESRDEGRIREQRNFQMSRTPQRVHYFRDQPVKCQLCGKNGHSAERCWSLQRTSTYPPNSERQAYVPSPRQRGWSPPRRTDNRYFRETRDNIRNNYQPMCVKI